MDAEVSQAWMLTECQKEEIGYILSGIRLAKKMIEDKRFKLAHTILQAHSEPSPSLAEALKQGSDQ